MELNFAIAVVDVAARIYRESLGVFHKLGAKWDCAACIEGLAAVAGMQGNAVRAIRLWSSATAIREAIRLARRSRRLIARAATPC